MVHGIPAHGGPEWSHRAQPQRASARAATIDAEINRTGALQVTTDDGDSVTISFAALQQLHAESFRGKAGGAKIAYGNESQTSGVSVNISVDGSLDEQEVADIGELLQQLSSAVQDPSATPDTAQLVAQLSDGGGLDSLSAFQFAYQEQTHVDYSSSRVRLAA